jgi:hypothetical protein
MDRQEAMKTLVQAGRHDDVRSAIDRRVQSAAAEYAGIRANPAWSEDYKRWALAVACTQHNRSLTEDLVKMAKNAVISDRGDAERVFGVSGLSGDAASLSISRRDAGDRVANVSKPDELQTLLARATRSGDEVMARAVAERALEIGDAKTLEKFAEDRPHLDSAVERLWEAQRREDSGTMEFAIPMAGLKPSEFGSDGFGSIEAVAQREPGAA